MRLLLRKSESALKSSASFLCIGNLIILAQNEVGGRIRYSVRELMQKSDVMHAIRED